MMFGLMTKKRFQEELDRQLAAERERRFVIDRIDGLENRLYKLEAKIEALEGRKEGAAWSDKPCERL